MDQKVKKGRVHPWVLWDAFPLLGPLSFALQWVLDQMMAQPRPAATFSENSDHIALIAK